MNWLLEKIVFDENLPKFIEAIQKQKHSFAVIEYNFLDADRVLKLFPSNSCVMTYGTLSLARHVINKSSWFPGAWCNLPKLECTHYYNYFGDFLLNKNYIMVPFGELKRQKEFLFNIIGLNKKIFARPSSGFKYFTGQLLNYDSFENELNYLEKYIDDDKIVVCSSPKEIIEEYRIVVIDSKVITGSRYKLKDSISSAELKEDLILKYAQRIADFWSPEIAYVMDVGLTKESELKLIEINSFSCSGLYNCDIEKVVIAASAAAEKEFKELET